MGNQLLKGYTIQGEPVSAIGCQKMWRIYQGHKQNTNAMCTIFAIQKKALAKAERQQLIQFAKRQAMGLARIRHPGVLAISETLIEDQTILAFSTEQIQGNLSTLARENKLKQMISNQIELRLNLFPLLDTIQFLHENVKTVHLGINFDNIYITKQGKWKISGFSNSHIFSGQTNEDLKNFKCANYYYCPPEIVNQKKFSKKSDVYSFGVLILDLLLVLVGRYEPKTYRSQSQYQQNFQKDLLKKLSTDALQKIDNYKQLKMLLKNVFARESQKRASLYELSSSKWLNDKLVLTVRYLQNITNYDSKQQVQFLKGLMGVVNNFEPKILMRKVMPLLLDLLKFKQLIPSVIFICLQMMKNGKIISQADFRERIWPSLKKVVQGKQMTAHSLYLFVQNMEKIQKVVGMQELIQCIVPLYVKCFDCPAKLKQLALHKTDYILSKMDYQFVKTKMIPKVMNCIKDQNPQIHKKSLIALRKSIKILDTQTITSIVLPGLQNCRKSGSDPFVNAITVSIYSMLGKSLPSQILCSKLIPTIMPYLSDPNVGPQDFYNYKNALMVMIQKIESERKKFWDESQITQGKGYTQKDFQFQEDPKKNNQNESNIGKGDYNFLSNYNNNQKPNNETQNRNQELPTANLNKKQSNQFSFSSPFNFDSSPSPYQAPSNQSNNYMNMAVSQNDYQFNSSSQSYYQNNSNNNNNNMGMGGFNFQSSLNHNRMQGSNQPAPPENKTNFPKLKGPQTAVNMNRVKKPEPALDPWASISLQDAPEMTQTGHNFGLANNERYNSNNSASISNNMNFGMNNAKTTGYGQPNTTIGVGSYGMGGNSMMGNIGDDPFADIQQKNAGNLNTNYGINMNNSGGYGINVQSNNQFNNGFQLGFSQQGTPNLGLNKMSVHGNPGSIGGMDFGYNTSNLNINNYGTANNQASSDPFSLIENSHQPSPKKQNTGSSDFDLI